MLKLNLIFHFLLQFMPEINGIQTNSGIHFLSVNCNYCWCILSMLHYRCDVALMSTTSTNLDLSLVTIFSAYIREKYLKLGIYLIDVGLKLIVPNSSIKYPFKDCFML